MGTLSGKAALVTGGARGIGAAIAERLAAEGAAVAVTYSRSRERAERVVEGIRARGGRAVAFEADSAEAEAVERAVDATAREFGSFDILVNNAGVAHMGPIAEFATEDFDRLVAVNIRGVFIASRAAARRMRAGGRIITVGSCVAERFGLPGGAVYAMTKAAVAALGRGMARDLGPRGITVNTVQPGPIDTEMNPAAGEFAPLMQREIAVGRYGRAEEIAAMVAFVAGPDAAFVNGASVTVDGGTNA